MATTPKFCITDAGLAAASIATPTGPWISIVGFRVGSAYGYDPQSTDTDLNGNLLYQGIPASYQYVGDNTINVICKIPADAGPFDFGEVAVYLEGDVMFAKAAFDTPQTKFTSLGTNLLSTYTFNCLLKLEQPVAVFKITSIDVAPSIWEVDLWSDVYPPALSANPLIPAILVRELDVNGESSLIHQAADDHWTLGTNYKLYAKKDIAGATLSTIDILKTDLDPSVVTGVNRKFVIETSDGYFRSVSSVVSSGINYRFNLNLANLPALPGVGDACYLYRSSADNRILYSDITDPPTLTLAGDVNGSAVLSAGTVTLTATLSNTAIQGRTQSFSTPGGFSFTVPANVFTLYVDGCGAGAGGGGAGGGQTTPFTDFVYPSLYGAGGGGGGGGAGESVAGYEMAVTPGQVIFGVIGAAGTGGAGGAPGNNGVSGTLGGDTSFGALIIPGGAVGGGGAGNGPPSGSSGAGAPGGVPGGFFGSDGGFGGAGGNGGTGPFGSGGPGARASTSPSFNGGDATGFGSGGGGGGGAYVSTDTQNGGNGGEGTGGFLRVTW